MDKRPNLIICMCDELRAFELGCYGHPHIDTPNIDAMCRAGLTLQRQYVMPVCSPTRGCLLTGRNSNRFHCELYGNGIPTAEHRTFPRDRFEEAAAYVAKLRQIMRYLGTCDGNMQNGNLRADVNISVCKPGDYEKYRETGDHRVLGTRCEVKNMNSAWAPTPPRRS